MKKKQDFITRYALDHMYLLWQIKPLRIALFGVLILPLVYSFIYLAAFYDPYANLKYLPVAIVNEDKGTVVNREQVHIGQDLIQALHKDSRLQWEFVSRKHLEKGLRRGDYYFGVIIPPAFSQQVSSLNSSSPIKGQLYYVTDESHNYVSNQIGSTMVKDLQKDIEGKLSTVFIDKLFKKMHDSTNQLASAAKGAELLSGYIEKAGQQTGVMGAGANQLKQGTGAIQEGIKQIHATLLPGKMRLEENLKMVATMQEEAHKVNELIQKWTSNSRPLEGVVSYLTKAEYAGKQTIYLLDEIAKANPEIISNPNFAQLQTFLHSISDNHKQMLHMTEPLQSEPALKTIANRSQQITDRIDQGVGELRGSLSQVEHLVEGMKKLDKAEAHILGGLSRLESGASKLEKGLFDISLGQQRLADGLAQGVQSVRESLAGSSQKEMVLSGPVDVKKQNVHSVPNYATGFAPYFISLALWVGSIILFTVLDLYQVRSRLNEQSISASVGVTIGMAQAVIVIAALTIGLGIQAILPGWLFFFTILISLTFMTINHMLVTLFNNFGRFLSIIILMLQLTSCSGTYPFQLLPKFFKVLHTFLPMTYSVQGLRAIISNGNLDLLRYDFLVLLRYLCGAFLITKAYLICRKHSLVKRCLSFTRS